jgi:putative hydrolase of the HAD superfamily
VAEHSSATGERQIQVEAVVFDYGGVLTSAVRDTTAQWLAADRIDHDSFYAVMREWMARDVDTVTPVHRLETGELAEAEFEVALAARLTTTSGGPVDAAGLLGRLFAGMRPDEDMLDLMGELRKAGIKVGLLSNSWANTYPADLAARCDAVVISGDVGLRKPDPAIYRLVLDQLGLSADRCVFVDDAPVNVDAATALGMRALRHTDAASTRAALRELVPSLGKVAS